MTQSLAPTLPPTLADASDEIPILDLAAYLRHIFERVGFYFITNHGVPRALIDRMFAEVKRFHAQPLDAKLRVKVNLHNGGYMPMRGATTRHSQISTDNKPNVNEAFFAKRWTCRPIRSTRASTSPPTSCA